MSRQELLARRNQTTQALRERESATKQAKVNYVPFLAAYLHPKSSTLSALAAASTYTTTVAGFELSSFETYHGVPLSVLGILKYFSRREVSERSGQK